MSLEVTILSVAFAAAAFLVIFQLLWQRKRWKAERMQSQQVLEEFERRFSTMKSDFSQEIFNQARTMSQELHHLNQNLGAALSETRLSVQSDLKSSAGLMADIHSRLGELGETSKRIHEVGINISSLEDLLKAPKIRGGIGEYFLEDLLSQILPGAFFTMQYSFRDGRMVDAVIRLGEQLICIDSKFPLDVFRQLDEEKDTGRLQALRREVSRVVKKHIDDISDKYIRPAEGTYNFALMYIPAEKVYYESIVREAVREESSTGVFEYAIQKKVIPVSPNCIYAYLQVILIGLKGFQIERETRQILSKLEGLIGQLGRFEARFATLGKHLGNAGDAFEKAHKQLDRFGQEIRTIEAIPEDPARAPACERPTLEEKNLAGR